MTSDWPLVSVTALEAEQVLLVQDGNHGEVRPRREELVLDGTPHIRAADINVDGSIDFAGAQRINDVALVRIRKGIGARGDVLLTHKGTVGRVGRVTDNAPPFVCSPQTTFWRSLDEGRLHQDFLYAYLRSPQFAAQLKTRMHDSDMAPYVSLTAQRSFVVPLPPIEVQRRIAGVLSAFDRKIIVDRRIEEHIRSLLVVLFRREVVMHPSDAAEKSCLSAIADFVNGRNFTKGASGAGRPVVRIRELDSGINKSTVFSDASGTPDTHVARFYDLLFAWSGTLGVHRWNGPDGLVNQHIFKVIPRQGIPLWFVEGWIAEHLPEFVRIARDKAVTMGHIRRSDLDRAPVLVPSPDRLRELDTLFGPLDARRKRAARERRRLMEIRAALLPALVSGRAEVPDAYEPSGSRRLEQKSSDNGGLQEEVRPEAAAV